MCWNPTNAVHRFKWVNSCFESFHHCGKRTFKLISTIFAVSHFWRTLIAKVIHAWMEVKPWGFGAQKKCPFPLNRGVRSKEVTNTKIIWRFCRDQILCPLNGGVPAWMQVSQRLHCTRLCRKMGQKLSPNCSMIWFDSELQNGQNTWGHQYGRLK